MRYRVMASAGICEASFQRTPPQLFELNCTVGGRTWSSITDPSEIGYNKIFIGDLFINYGFESIARVMTKYTRCHVWKKKIESDTKRENRLFDDLVHYGIDPPLV